MGISVSGLGRFGVWRSFAKVTPGFAAEVEELGYGTLWLGSTPSAVEEVEPLLAATTDLVVASGIVNVWAGPPADVARSFARLEERHPGRFLLGIGIGHPEATAQYRSPYEALVRFLDGLDAGGVPRERRVLAALGPRVLRLARDRTLGAHPYLVPPAHTALARRELGQGVLLAPEQKVVLGDDADAARAVGRPVVDQPYLHLTNYVSNLRRLGWTDRDIADGGSDALIDDLVARGSVDDIARRLHQHLDAGADHVAIQALAADDDALPTLRALAPVLGLRTAPTAR
ncbi:LLM class F420-dependent oxidoreductase [Nakamurella endophytica]|uniref:LLM class F420-dependent oxidoreductase n=1 Tax=Nakamurella endophytica TaxID=1748367 RepID=A0A917WCF3_9ACTN|nr:LLM class F420-dependent oxidoreductase [Nakamurella endophytica]GGL94110.1 LLM class F420-dependent oxidoreductase [Nakamurella endophytica]